MKATKTTHRFTNEEIKNLKESTGDDDTEEALRTWAYHNYPVQETGYFSIGNVQESEEGGEIEIEKRV